MSVKDKTAKMMYLDNVTAQTIKEIAGVYDCSESSVIRKALHNYISLYIDLAKKGKEWKQHPAVP